MDKMIENDQKTIKKLLNLKRIDHLYDHPTRTHVAAHVVCVFLKKTY